MNLDRPIEHGLRHAWRDDFNHCNLGARRLVAFSCCAA
jgi:hypothetical protein